LETLGQVEHFISIQLFKPNEDQDPTEMEIQSEAQITISSGKNEEKLHSKTISSTEDRTHHHK